MEDRRKQPLDAPAFGVGEARQVSKARDLRTLRRTPCDLAHPIESERRPTTSAPLRSPRHTPVDEASRRTKVATAQDVFDCGSDDFAAGVSVEVGVARGNAQGDAQGSSHGHVRLQAGDISTGRRRAGRQNRYRWRRARRSTRC